MKQMRCLLILIVFLFSFTDISHAQRVNINPTQLNFNTAAGETSTQTLTISNVSDEKQVFQLSVGDWLRDSLGNHQYLPAGKLRRSCAPWISLENVFVELEPRTAKDIRITLAAPADSMQMKEMKWAMLFIQSVKEQVGNKKKKGKVNAVINEIFRFGIHIYQIPPGVHDYSAKALMLREDPVTRGLYNFTIENTGNIMLQCFAHLELTNMESGEEIKLPNTEFPIFPEAKRTIPLQLPANLKKGRYSVLALLEYHDDLPLEAIEMTIEIKT
ncbi:fimbrial biogenesis chaperone [Pedobacter gandavensis]|uniref:Molecular chaperone n=1 Tax=Pedobacter gandavensis TaxID=2679963 RepID=A0ABR6EXH4_9SPHI|nr:hypothetical protein [Pedobacter gandavensis]MBB2149876.1 hypothetical protein [Pedobacter gandavensis]